MPVIIWLCDRAMRFQSKPTFHPCSPQSPSSSVVRASVLEHGGSWVHIPSGTRIFFRVRCYLYLTHLLSHLYWSSEGVYFLSSFYILGKQLNGKISKYCCKSTIKTNAHQINRHAASYIILPHQRRVVPT